MTIVAVDCIKNGRADQFGGPLVSGGSYTLPWSLARSLWLSGYVSVTNPSIFGGGDTDVYLSNLAASLAEIGVPSPIVICGLPFVLFPGDGGSNGLLFTGTAGNFSLSAAMISGLQITNGYGYLPSNSGGLGNAAGIYYFEMSSDTAGTFYNNTHDPTSETTPTIPAVLVPFANPAGGRLTQVTSEITVLQKTVDGGSFGPSGGLEYLFSVKGTNTAGAKYHILRADGTAIYSTYFTTNSCLDGLAIIQNAGKQTRQSTTRSNNSVGSTPYSTLNNNYSDVDFSATRVLTVSAKVYLNTEGLVVAPRRLSMWYGS